MSVWCKEKIKIGPGRYTGTKELKALSAVDHKQGFQSWAKKVQHAQNSGTCNGDTITVNCS